MDEYFSKINEERKKIENVKTINNNKQDIANRNISNPENHNHQINQSKTE